MFTLFARRERLRVASPATPREVLVDRSEFDAACAACRRPAIGCTTPKWPGRRLSPIARPTRNAQFPGQVLRVATGPLDRRPLDRALSCPGDQFRLALEPASQ